MKWKKLPPYKGQIKLACNFDSAPIIAPLQMIIAVGFGAALVTKDGIIIFQEESGNDDFTRLQEFENMAKNDPDHDWKVILEAPLSSKTYQRHENDKWVLVELGDGFA